MPETGQIHIAYTEQRRRLSEVEPIVYQDEDRLTLQFQIGEIQSEMLAHNPNFLVLSYTRTMMAFLLFHSDPRRIAMIGLGGGSMPKWCYRQLPSADITVIEINPKVIALRDEFHIPPDDYRFRVICEDGADYVARTSELTEVLLVDGFDIHGQPPQLCSQEFYDHCHRALAPDGLLVVNLCGLEDRRSIERIQRSFDDRVLVALPEDGDNKVVFAIKGDRLWMKDDLSDELLNRLRLRHAQNDFPKLGFRSRHCKWASHPNPQSPAIDALEDLCEATEKR
jgi:spermidine synthase